MGCGKSTLARRIARRTGVVWTDTDRLVEEREGASAVDIFRYAGEEYFRRAERAVLDALIDKGEPCVVATGGGLPAWRDNMERMNGAGLTVWIDRPVEEIARRMSPYGRQRRPRLWGLTDGEIVGFMRRDLAGRAGCYAAARMRVDCAALSDEEAEERILEAWRRENG